MVVPLCLFAADWMPYAFGMVCCGSPGRVDLLKLLLFVYLQLRNVIHYSGNNLRLGGVELWFCNLRSMILSLYNNPFLLNPFKFPLGACTRLFWVRSPLVLLFSWAGDNEGSRGVQLIWGWKGVRSLVASLLSPYGVLTCIVVFSLSSCGAGFLFSGCL